MTDALFISWMIAGTILSIVLTAVTKQPKLSTVVGFIMAPALPAVIIYAAIDLYLESRK